MSRYDLPAGALCRMDAANLATLVLRVADYERLYIGRDGAPKCANHRRGEPIAKLRVRHATGEEDRTGDGRNDSNPSLTQAERRHKQILRVERRRKPY